MSEARLRLGDMLLEAGLISKEQLTEALQRQKSSGRKLGGELVASGLLTEVQMTQILSNQLSVPWVSLYHVEFSRELLNLLPAEVAESCCAIPVYVRRVRRAGDTLFVAMDDPTNQQAIGLVQQATGMPVKPMVAAPSEINDAIRVYYFGGKPRTVAPPPSEEEPPSSPEAAAEIGDAPEARPASQPAPAAEEPAKPAEPAKAAEAAKAVKPAKAAKAAKPPEASEADRRREQLRRGAARLMTLTLLDGTTVRIPTPGSRSAAAEEKLPEHLTASDLISALMRRSRGEDVSDVLPDEGWEALFATLLALLVRKGLVADWEFVEEWQKRRED